MNVSSPATATQGPVSVGSKNARDVAGVFLTKVATYPLVIVSGILVARILGPSDRGIYSFLLLFSGFLLPILSFGLGASIIYYLSSGQYDAREITFVSVLAGAGHGGLAALSIGGLWHFGLLGKTAAVAPPAVVLLMLALLPAQGAYLMATRVVLGVSWFSLNNLVTLLAPTITSIALLVLVVFCRLGVLGAALAALFANLAALGVVLVGLWRRYRPKCNWNSGFLRDGYTYGVRAWWGDIAIRLNLRADQFILGIAASPTSLGVYAVAVNLTEALWLLPDSMAFVTFNLLAASKSPAERQRLVAQIHRALVLAMFIVALGLAVAAPWLVRWLYGAKFADATVSLWFLLPGTVLMTSTKVITKFFGASAMPGRSSIIAIVGAFAGCLFYLLLIPVFDAAGAALASSLGYAVTSATAVVLYRRATRPHPMKLMSFSIGDVRWLRDQLRRVIPRKFRSFVP